MGEWSGGGWGNSPVEDSDDDLMPVSLCNVIPGMVNMDTAGGWGRVGGGVGEGGGTHLLKTVMKISCLCPCVMLSLVW